VEDGRHATGLSRHFSIPQNIVFLVMLVCTIAMQGGGGVHPLPRLLPGKTGLTLALLEKIIVFQKNWISDTQKKDLV
jgi:hypothetical protein